MKKNFITNKILIDKTISKQKIQFYNIKQIDKIVLPDSKYINNVVLRNDLLYVSLNYILSRITEKDTMFDFSNISYFFNKYYLNMPIKYNTLYRQLKTIKCNPIFSIYNFYMLNEDNSLTIGNGNYNKEQFIKWYEKKICLNSCINSYLLLSII